MQQMRPSCFSGSPSALPHVRTHRVPPGWSVQLGTNLNHWPNEWRMTSDATPGRDMMPRVHVLWTCRWGARGRFGRSTIKAASPPPTQACSGGAGDSTHSVWLLVKMRPVQSAVTDLEHVTNPVCHEPHLPVRQLATEGENRGTSGGEERKKMSFAFLNYL